MIIKEVVEDFPQPDNDGGRFSTVIHGICFKSKINFNYSRLYFSTSAFTNLNQNIGGNGISLLLTLPMLARSKDKVASDHKKQ